VRWWLAVTCELGPDLLPFFLSNDMRWWLTSGDLFPLPFSYLIFFFTGAGGARASGSVQGWRTRWWLASGDPPPLPSPSPTSSSFLQELEV
jgi:hypothetical protein